LECLSIKNKLNPFALRLKLLINASRCAYAELQQFRAAA
ncbi:MAG: IS701 family transposase, partial [Solimonas sp.]